MTNWLIGYWPVFTIKVINIGKIHNCPLTTEVSSLDCVCVKQVVILERRNEAGKILYKPILGGWNGSKEDKHKLLEELERLQKDPSILNYDAILPELNNEFASVSLSGFAFHGASLIAKLALSYMHVSVEIHVQIVF